MNPPVGQDRIEMVSSEPVEEPEPLLSMEAPDPFVGYLHEEDIPAKILLSFLKSSDSRLRDRAEKCVRPIHLGNPEVLQWVVLQLKRPDGIRRFGDCLLMSNAVPQFLLGAHLAEILKITPELDVTHELPSLKGAAVVIQAFNLHFDRGRLRGDLDRPFLHGLAVTPEAVRYAVIVRESRQSTNVRYYGGGWGVALTWRVCVVDIASRRVVNTKSFTNQPPAGILRVVGQEVGEVVADSPIPQVSKYLDEILAR